MNKEILVYDGFTKEYRNLNEKNYYDDVVLGCSFKNFIENVWVKLQTDYDYHSEDDSENSAIEWLKNQVSFLEQDAFNFIKILNFYKEDGLSDVELKIRKHVAEILGVERKEIVERATNNLLAKLSYWSTSRRDKQEIFREDIYNELCVESTNIPNYEIYPEKPIFPSREDFAEPFMEKLKNGDKKVFFVQGLPGAGKTNFVSYLSQLENSIVDFRFYTYLPVNKEHPSFSDDEGYYSGDLLWRSILHQLKKCFEAHNLLYKLKFPLIYSYLSVTEMRNMVLKYLPEYAKVIGRTCYLFIDGLDHAARSRNARDSFLHQLPIPSDIHGDVKFVYVGQPINDKYPKDLINNNQIDYIELPMLEEKDVAMLLLKEEIDIKNIARSSLAKSIVDVIGNNALNIFFALKEVKRLKDHTSFDLIVTTLQERNLNNQISKYYEWIISSIENGGILLLKIKIIFAFASQKIKISDIAEMCGTEIDEVIFILNQIYPLIECSNQEYYHHRGHLESRLLFHRVCTDTTATQLLSALFHCL